jgi:phage terminase Nu1 subunit (DNA packaging protein)
LRKIMADEKPGQVRINDQLATAAQLADYIGLSVNTINQMASKGTFTRMGRYQFLLRASILAYRNSLRQSASGRGGEGESARTRLLQSQARQAEAREAAMRGEYISRAEADNDLFEVVRFIRARFLAVPTRFAGRFPHLTPLEISDIDREVRQILDEIADGPGETKAGMSGTPSTPETQTQQVD